MKKETMSVIYMLLGIIAYGASFFVAIQVGNITKATEYWHNSTPDDTKQAFEFVVYWVALLITGKCCMSLSTTTLKQK